VAGNFFQYFDRVAIVHLPTRTDRFLALSKELSRAGFDINDPKVVIPPAPTPDEANGFPSRGVYGNFLSHLGILEQAFNDNLETVLVLEDDAIFSRTFISKQSTIADNLESNRWDQFFLGHSISGRLPPSQSGIVRFSGGFVWSHCYAIHRRIMPRMIEYFRKTIARPAGHPEGAKMYIDGAHTLFRRLNPDIICLVSSPCMSVQKGSPSNLNASLWYDRNRTFRRTADLVRNLRDDFWRRGWIGIHAKGRDLSNTQSATVWPPIAPKA
jgi:glycosyl transferase, family 25